jgi:hypothetical protein
MPTIKERLAQLDKKISDEQHAGNSSPEEECNLQYRIRYATPQGEALSQAKLARSAVASQLRTVELEISKKERELDKLKASLEAAEFTVFTLENLPSPL